MISLDCIRHNIVSFKQNKEKSNTVSTPQDSFKKSIPSNECVQLYSPQVNNSSFFRFINEYNLLDKLPQILKTPENILGKGFSHVVYSIPNCKDYVLRTSRFFDTESADFLNVKAVDKEDKNLKINIGQVIGEIEVKGSDYYTTSIEVLKKQPGKPIGNPPSQAIFAEGAIDERDYESPERKKKYASSLRLLASLPVESYEDLIKKYIEVSEMGYTLDHLNSNNLFVDNENQSINFIDMQKAKTKPDYGNLLYALTNINYFDTYTSYYGETPVSNDEINNAFENTIEIISKYVEAMKRQGVKFDFENKSCEFLKFLMSMPVSFLCKTYDINEKQDYFIEQGV